MVTGLDFPALTASPGGYVIPVFPIVFIVIIVNRHVLEFKEFPYAFLEESNLKY